MKKIFFNLIAVVFLATLVFAGCGEYTGIQNKPPVTDGGNNEQTPPPVDGDTESEFSVSLVYDDLPLLAEVDTEGMQIQWSDGFNYHRADVVGSKATIKGLDGDYQVTVLGLPKGYSYNPNVHRATNLNKDITIEVYKVTKPRVTSTAGSGLYSCVKLSRTAMYSVDINSANHKVYFEYTPTAEGDYSVESWVDLTANNINPKVDVYSGTFAAKFFNYTLDDGGEVSSFTKNFKYVVGIGEDMKGNTFTFAIHAQHKDDDLTTTDDDAAIYPITVNFVIQKDGSFTDDNAYADAELVRPTEDFYRAPTPGYAYTEAHEYVADENRWELNGSYYELNPSTGYYHRVQRDAEGNVIAWGELLFAHISSNCYFIDAPFTTIEYAGNKALTITLSKEERLNYKLFIEGSHAINYVETDRAYYIFTMSEEEKAWWSSHSYYDYVNGDGLYPVTEELKQFLQYYSVNQRLFNDGNGFAETKTSPYSVDSMEDDQWLFACCYYKDYTGEDWIAAKKSN
ncbi:MAG: hypothetical protein J6B04_03390 [Clostridia bacterium]|nr:hypothetical protein [Clostridia bacterium]